MTPVPPDELLVSGLVVGIVMGGDIGTEAMSLPSRRTLLGGIDLVVPPPGGDPIADRGLRAEVASEVEALLGGWFHAGLESVTELRDSLAGRELRERLAVGGITVPWDQPRRPYSWLAFREEGWQVQAVGELGDFHCVALARALTEAEALGPGGHVRWQPAGPPLRLLATAAPALRAGELRDRTAEHPANVLDLHRKGRGLTVRGGVRLATTEEGGAWTHYYVIRVDAELAKAGTA